MTGQRDDEDAEDQLESQVRRGAPARPEPPQAAQPTAAASNESVTQPAIRPWLPPPDEESARSRALPPDGVIKATLSAPRPDAASRTTQTLATNRLPESVTDYAPAPARARYDDNGVPPYPPQQVARQKTSGGACVWLFAIFALAIVAIIFVFVSGISSAFSNLPGFPRLPFVTPTTIINASQPSVISQILPLGRLESVQYSVEKVISGESTGSFPLLTSDKILFVAHGEVIAGVDLNKLSESDITVISDSVTINLPQAEILSHSLNNDKSYVYNRETGLFTKADPNLETEVRQKADSQIVEATLEDGILTTAQNNAEATLRTLLLSLGYKQVTFTTKPGPAVTATP